jgi:hypothetical protein
MAERLDTDKTYLSDVRPRAATAASQKVPASGAMPERIVIEVIDGPLDGLLLAEELATVTIGRAPNNTFRLFYDQLASGKHATITYSEQTKSWILEDLGSTNGTWVDTERIMAPCVLSQGMNFLIGSSVIRFMAGNDLESYLPEPEEIASERDRLTGKLEADLAVAYGAAVAMAIGERSKVVTDRYLLLCLSILNPELPGIDEGNGPLSQSLLVGEVWPNNYWQGKGAWIAQVLGSNEISKPPFFKQEVTLAPRALKMLLQAEAIAAKHDRNMIQSVDVMGAIFSDPQSRSRLLCERRGLDTDHLLNLLSNASALARSEPKVMPDAVVVPSAAETNRQIPLVSPGVHDTAQEMSRVASLYHLAEASERRAVLREVLQDTVAKLPSANERIALLEQLRELFPIETNSEYTETEEVLRLQHEIEVLRKKLSMVKVDPGRPPSRIAWESFFSDNREEALLGLDAREEQALVFVGEVIDFATNMEKFMVEWVMELTKHGGVTNQHKLPGHETSIQTVVHRLRSENATVDEKALKTYLVALTTWLVAAITAYHEAPLEWFFDEFWVKVKPTRIETQVRGAFGIDAAKKRWEKYREETRLISQGYVDQQIKGRLGAIAEKQFDDMIKKRNGVMTEEKNGVVTERRD